ncbi:MAG: HD domain-containing protein [bacterium]
MRRTLISHPRLWDHTERVRNLAVRIGRLEGANVEVVRIAALLHDIGKAEVEGEPRRGVGVDDHAIVGARVARGIIEESQGLLEEEVANIIHCIKTHHPRGLNVPETLEAKVLADANSLDDTGAVGLAKLYALAGEHGLRLYGPPEEEPLYSDDTPWRRFRLELCRIAEGLFTETARSIAQERQEFLSAFFDRLFAEVAGEA